MHRELRESLSRLLGEGRADELISEVARRRHVSWPPVDVAAFRIVLDELERTVPGAVSVTARTVRRRLRSSGSLPAIVGMRGVYADVLAMLAESVDVAIATDAFDDQLRARGLTSAHVDAALAVEILEGLARRPDDVGRAAAFAKPRVLLLHPK